MAYGLGLVVYNRFMEGIQRTYSVHRFSVHRRLVSVTVDTFEARQKRKGPKVTTVLRIAMRTTPIPVTVDIFAARREHEGPKVRTLKRMEALKRQKIKRTTVTRMEALRRQKRRQLRGWRPRGV